MAYEWVGTALVGLAGIYSTYKVGERQRQTQKYIAEQQDYRKNFFEIEKVKRETYSKVIARLGRAVGFTYSEKFTSRLTRASLDKSLKQYEQEFLAVLDSAEVDQLPPGEREKLQHLRAKVTDLKEGEERTQVVQNIVDAVHRQRGYSTVGLHTQVAMEELEAGLAEIEFLSEGNLQPACQAVLSALRNYVSASDDEEEDLYSKLKKAVDELQRKMLLDLSSVHTAKD
ncbi:hypothetical protein AB0E59_44880 [Lentzea sp. NPDC034063]|uniref:hypothetical protein n=1 Tax=unclassified Lentzea TaxID=2643253 RepID=UPI00340EAABD